LSYRAEILHSDVSRAAIQYFVVKMDAKNPPSFLFSNICNSYGFELKATVFAPLDSVRWRELQTLSRPNPKNYPKLTLFYFFLSCARTRAWSWRTWPRSWRSTVGARSARKASSGPNASLNICTTLILTLATTCSRSWSKWVKRFFFFNLTMALFLVWKSIDPVQMLFE